MYMEIRTVDILDPLWRHLGALSLQFNIGMQISYKKKAKYTTKISTLLAKNFGRKNFGRLKFGLFFSHFGPISDQNFGHSAETLLKQI